MSSTVAESGAPSSWEPKLVGIGVPKDVLQAADVDPQKYETLYNRILSYRKVIGTLTITETWQLEALSGKTLEPSIEKTDSLGYGVPYYMALSGNLEGLQLLKETECLKQSDEKKYTILHFALLSGNTECLDWLQKNTDFMKINDYLEFIVKTDDMVAFNWYLAYWPISIMSLEDHKLDSIAHMAARNNATNILTWISKSEYYWRTLYNVAKREYCVYQPPLCDAAAAGCLEALKWFRKYDTQLEFNYRYAYSIAFTSKSKARGDCISFLSKCIVEAEGNDTAIELSKLDPITFTTNGWEEEFLHKYAKYDKSVADDTIIKIIKEYNPKDKLLQLIQKEIDKLTKGTEVHVLLTSLKTMTIGLKINWENQSRFIPLIQTWYRANEGKIKALTHPQYFQEVMDRLKLSEILKKTVVDQEDKRLKDPLDEGPHAKNFTTKSIFATRFQTFKIANELQELLSNILTAKDNLQSALDGSGEIENALLEALARKRELTDLWSRFSEACKEVKGHLYATNFQISEIKGLERQFNEPRIMEEKNSLDVLCTEAVKVLGVPRLDSQTGI